MMEDLRKAIEEEVAELEVKLKTGTEEGHFVSIYGIDVENQLKARLAGMRDVLAWMPPKEVVCQKS